MARKTKYDYYDDAFKATAVELGALPGVHAKDVAEVLDIHPIRQLPGFCDQGEQELEDGQPLHAYMPCSEISCEN